MGTNDRNLANNNVKANEVFGFLTQNYSLEELREICLRMGIDDERFDGTNKYSFARELVQYCERRRLLSRLHEETQLSEEAKPSTQNGCNMVVRYGRVAVRLTVVTAVVLGLALGFRAMQTTLSDWVRATPTVPVTPSPTKSVEEEIHLTATIAVIEEVILTPEPTAFLEQEATEEPFVFEEPTFEAPGSLVEVPLVEPVSTASSPICDFQTLEIFLENWIEVQWGCPLGPPMTEEFEYTNFERGYTLDWYAEERIYVLYSANGTWEAFVVDRSGPRDDCEIDGSSSSSLGRSANDIWCENESIRSALGNPKAQSSYGIYYLQEFVEGLMIGPYQEIPEWLMVSQPEGVLFIHKTIPWR